jgi:hypothetical protein
MRLINFENNRKDKIPFSDLIFVITTEDTIELGWTNGRDMDEIIKDFGEKDKDWFYFRYKAEEYLYKKKEYK